MSNVFVIDSNKQPVNPVHPARARMLLTQGKAAVFRRYPFTLILKCELAHTHQIAPLRVKIDPGSKVTGLAVVNDVSGEVVWAAELTHRGEAIKEALASRSAVRASRRKRKTRYRPSRRSNKRVRRGWLPPSFMSRVLNIETWIKRLCRYAPITSFSQEVVAFDTQLLQNPDISGIEYQQGTLAGYEVRQYLLEKWGRQCAYCGAKNIPLQVEHILCRKLGGSHRISNLTLACNACNQKKNTRNIQEFLKDQPDLLKRIVSHTQTPLRDAAAVQATKWELLHRLQATGLPVECGTGGRTKYNRSIRNLDKAHWIDAACVGASTPMNLQVQGIRPLLIQAMGHGNRQMCSMDKYGFPRTGPKGPKFVKGFQTGDIARAIVPSGKHRGTYEGRIKIRTRGAFGIPGQVDDINYRFFRRIHCKDGYRYRESVRQEEEAKSKGNSLRCVNSC